MGDRKFVQDYTLVCRTCLQSNVEMLSLSALIYDNVKEETTQISYMDCLKTCIQVEENLDVEMPQKICMECSSVLRVSYWFMKNATQAQELLKLKLNEIKRKKHQIEMEKATENSKKTKRYRCKICNVKVETKRSLKDHVKLHLDIIVYNCQLCSFENHNRDSLCDHYTQIHSIEPTKEQLKPRTKLSSTSPGLSVVATPSRIDGAIKTDHFQILPEVTQNISFNASEGNINSDHNIANEFIVMADGSLRKVMDKDVVIEYINTSNNGSTVTFENGLPLDNIIQVENLDNTVLVEHQNDIGQMDVDDLIIEDRNDVAEEVQEPVILPLEEDAIPATFIEQPKKLMCKICTKDFPTQEKLKNHMLTHNEIPHFFCDQCTFYTFFKIDLHQHYKSKHNLQPTNKQLQPKNKQKNCYECYSCDLCFYETGTRPELKRHYKTRHSIEAKDIHLKPTKVNKLKSSLSLLSAKARVNTIAKNGTSKNMKIRSIEESPDYPNGLNCRKCNELFYYRNKLYEHYKMHNAEEAALKQEKQLIKIQNHSSNLYHDKIKSTKILTAQTTKVVKTSMETTTSASYHSLGTLALSVTTANVNTLNSMAPLTPSSSSTYTLPSDAIPQIVETDQTIENDMDFYFNCDNDNLFRDFDDDVDVENDSNDEDTEFCNILLTSDDDFDEILQYQNNANNASSNTTIATAAFCAHCQKSFITQYQFENHMFIHRGLAPYRCELCTNLYNTKRCLIRHYRAVHKNVPTRDMIQAKGDKVCDDKTILENLKLEATTCFMCAKCPYETSQISNIKFHLKSSHNIDDDSYVMKKLPFECPRCIRSFESKLRLLRHLERNHSLLPINQHQVRFDSVENTSELAAITSATVNETDSNVIDASCAHRNAFVKEKQQHAHQHPNPLALTPTSTGSNFPIESAITSNIVVGPFEKCNSQTIPQLIYNDSSTNSNDSTTTNILSTSDEFIQPSTTIDENDFSLPLFKCKVCFLTCYNLATFNQHSKRIDCRKTNATSSDHAMPFECEICHCNYKTMYLLKHHLKRHIGRKFLCAECPKTFINKVELAVHKQVHSGERLHKCDVCTKSFLYLHHLKRHKDSVHFGKRHICTEPDCTRKFTTLAQLKVHVWSHNGIVPYNCPFCNRLFKKRLLLREHCTKIHCISLSEEQMAEIFRNSLGYTNPHDFTVTIGNGKMLRRGDLETMCVAGVIKSSFK